MHNKNIKNKFLTGIVGLTIAVCPIGAVLNPVMVAKAHCGANSHGGHHSGRSETAYGSYYYYCGGHPAHLHENGVCPYVHSSVPSVSASSAAVQNTQQQAATADPAHMCGWQRDQVGWWYRESDGQYKKDGKCMIDGHCFLFDNSGYMQTGWHEIDHCWNYFDGNGYMTCGWKEINGIWYYFDSLGCMVTGSHCIDDKYYYFGEDGAWDGNYYDEGFNNTGNTGQ